MFSEGLSKTLKILVRCHRFISLLISSAAYYRAPILIFYYPMNLEFIRAVFFAIQELDRIGDVSLQSKVLEL